jgi:5-methyltetrahydrofolate--homocysteine methyltransferase
VTLAELLCRRGLAPDGGVLLLDGAMGTQLFARGLTSGDSPELWNLEHPADITAIHREYLDAGSDLVLTNSFGGTRFRLALHGLDARVVEINEAAARNARGAVDACERPALVAGSIGPTGELLEPLGPRTPAEMTEAFAEQARGLHCGGVDLFWIETMSHLDEIAAAVEGCRQASPATPVVATVSFDTAGRSMMGVSGQDLAGAAARLGIHGFGANCGATLRETEAAVGAMVEADGGADPDRIVVSKANAGIPRWGADGLVYDGTPAMMAAHAHRVRAAGARFIGACCGSTPEHIAYMRKVLDGELPVPDAPPPAAPERPAAGSDGGRAGRRRRTPHNLA